MAGYKWIHDLTSSSPSADKYHLITEHNKFVYIAVRAGSTLWSFPRSEKGNFILTEEATAIFNSLDGKLDISGKKLAFKENSEIMRNAEGMREEDKKSLVSILNLL